MQALMWGFCSGHCSKALDDDIEAPQLLSTLISHDLEDHEITTAATLLKATQFEGLQQTPSMSTPVAAQPRAPKIIASLDALIEAAPEPFEAAPEAQAPAVHAPEFEKEERVGSKGSSGTAESKGTEGRTSPVKKAVAVSEKRSRHLKPAVRPAAAKAAAAEKAKAQKAAAAKAAAEAVANAAIQKANAEAAAQQLQMNAEAEVKQNNLTAALLICSQAIELHKEYSAAWAGRGGIHLRQGDLNAALSDLDEALRLDGKLLVAMCNRAEVKSKLDDLNGSIDDYNNYLMLAPCDGRALYHRADAKLRNGMADEAEKDFQLAKRLGYTRSKPFGVAKTMSKSRLGGC